MASLGRMPPGRDNRHRSHPANQGHLSKDIALKGSDSFLFCLLTELRGRFQDVTQLSPVPFAGGNIEEEEDLDFDNLVLTQAMPLHRPPRCASFSPSQFPKLVCAMQGHQTRHGDASLRRHERKRRTTRTRTSTGTSWSLLMYNNLLRRTWQPGSRHSKVLCLRMT